MTPKEKASSIVHEITATIFESGCTVSKPMVKEVAFICVEEILNSRSEHHSQRSQKDFNDYWQSVRTEIESL